MNLHRWTCLALALLWVVPLPARGDATVDNDTATLREAGVKADGPALLEFFRKRTFSDDDRARLAALVRQLGHEDFATREKASEALMAAGRSVLPLLLPALKDSDPEIRRRAELCVESIQSGSDLIVVCAAARVLAVCKPEGAAATLLRYLPSSSDDIATEAVLTALDAVRLRDGAIDPALPPALTDKEPIRRAAAALVLGLHSPEHRPAVKKLLADPNEHVRFRAASTLARKGEKAAISVLIALVSEAGGDLPWLAEDILYRLAGDKAPQVALGGGGEDNRKKCREAWEAWWDKNQARVDLAQLDREEADTGHKVVCELQGGAQGGGRVFEYGPDDRIRWQFDNVNGPIDVKPLPGGRVIIAEINANRVTERDRQGQILFEAKFDNSPMACQRLPNGNTFVATYTEIAEVTREGKTVYSYRKPDQRIYYAHKLRNGNIIYVTAQGQIYELTEAGKEVRRVQAGDTSNWGSVELLPNGNFLVARCGLHQVVEIDPTGKELWKVDVQWPTWAKKRSNGRVLVASAHDGQVVEFDRDGKAVWRQKLTGRPCRVHRY
jgi:HEAT repeat protein